MPVTDYIQAIEDIIQETVDQLEAVETTWNVEVFSGTSYAELFEFLPGVRPPAAIVCWQGAEVNRTPGRPQRIYHQVTVLVLARHADPEQGAVTARELLDLAMGALDEHVATNARWRVMGLAAVDLSDAETAPGVACYAIECEVGDH